ncbi:TAXI family TRAP transporter solute-binding subunit [Nesterenkonia natronophila]|uniref:TAXI family TRAP transporter solute-binding subunit n=1 Tax=Nesterenkonia natronophila TaxID=2174932 RepID=A0A3A4F2B5_9MICC|nr:TAXI family TRAP transporter solute-binding subunit [Nesterenkonia natronophila]RJN31861.1 TAXI family TRAP transporter solute-binding subunit [Nesterenkonia natronophila]
MTIRRTAAAMTAVAAMTALAACGDDNGDDNGNGDEGDAEVEVGSEDDFITDLEFTTGGTGGTYYPLGGELSEIFSAETDASVNYVESGGSGENLGRIYNEQSQLALTQNDTAAEAINGELEDLDGIEINNVGWIANLYPEAMHIVVREDSGIESIEDLDGTTIAVGDAGSGTRAISDAILEYYEIDYTPEVTDFGASTEMLGDDQIDASMFVAGPPVAALTSLAATTDVTLLSVDDSDAEEIAEGGLFDPYDIEGDIYDFLDEDVTTLSVFAALAASTTQVSDDLAYDITAALFDNSDSITLEVGENISTDEALLGLGEIPLHPGAERYYEEQDVDLP